MKTPTVDEIVTFCTEIHAEVLPFTHEVIQWEVGEITQILQGDERHLKATTGSCNPCVDPKGSLGDLGSQRRPQASSWGVRAAPRIGMSDLHGHISTKSAVHPRAAQHTLWV